MSAGAIRAAFEALFTNGGIPTRPQRVRKVESLTSSIHKVLDRVDVMTGEGPQQAWVIATKACHKTPQGSRLVARHASPGTLQNAEQARGAPQVLH